MPLQSSGIIVVDKTSVIAAASGNSTASTSSANKSNIQQYYELYDINDGSSNNIIGEPNNNNGTNNTNTTTNSCNNNSNILMRRHQRTISSSSSSSIHSPSSVTVQQQQQQSQQLKHHQVVTTNLQTLAYNQQQQQQQQMNQQHHHHQQATSSTTQPQQLIVSEEYIEQTTTNHNNNNSQVGGGSNGNNGGNVLISPSNEVLNQQIIKIVTADGTTGNMIIDSMGNVTTTNGNATVGGSGGTNGSSKVLFNNLTVLSKQTNNSAGSGGVTTTGQLTHQQQQHHQQTINFVNAKGLPYITTTTSKGQTTTVQKMTAYKGNNVAIKQNTTASQQQQHHVLSTTGGGGHTVIGQQPGQPQQQVVQKVTMPRNVQMVTRVQTLVAPQHSPQQQQQQQQQHISSQQHSTTSGQMVMQQKYVHNIVTTGTSVGGKTNLIKKSAGQSMKLQQHKIISTQQQQGGVKTFIQQQSSNAGAGGGSVQQQHYQTINIHQSQHQGNTGTVVPQTTLKHVKSQKIIKQYNNAITNNSGTVSVATLHQNHSANVSSSATSGTYTISNKVNNVSSAGVHQQHHISTKISKQPKYVMQNHIVIPTSSNAASQNQNHKVNNANNNSIMVNQQILNINSCNTSSGTIKFVNAHGTVIQQQQQQQAPTIITTTQKVRTNSGSSGGGGNHQYQSPQQVHITQQQFVTADGGKSTDGSNIYHISSTPTGGYIQSSGPQQNAQQASPMHTDDIMMMTDEVSARILQSMAQKSFSSQQRFHQQPTATTKIIHQSNSMPPPTQMTVQKQQHHTSTSNLILSPKEYPIYGVQQQQPYQQQQQRLCNSAPNSRSQSLERKYHDTTISTKKAAVEYYKVKSDVMNNQSQQQQQQASAVAMASRIPVGTTLTQHHHQQQPQTPQQHLQQQPQQQQSSAEQDDELIGEEIRPIPVNTTDLRLQVLQAVLQDHTYAVAMSTRFPVELLPGSSVIAVSPAQPLQQQQTQPQQQSVVTTVAVSPAVGTPGQPKIPSDAKVVHFANGTTGGGSNTTNVVSQLSMINVNAQNNQHSVAGGPPTTTSYTIYGQQIARPQQDDDAHSAISNGSTRIANASGDIDPGEETETAPEAEAEDDSITRCICDLTHDDGYMICCDKCSAWQHVDCMGIDRQNIPDEYLCELCQPREVDHARARSLQLLKRKEQTQLLLNAAHQNAAIAAGLIPNDTVNGGVGTMAQQQQSGGLPGALGTVPPQLTKKGKLIKRKELVKKAKKEKTTGVSGSTTKRRDNKKTAKRKSKSSTSDPVDKHAANLRQWIENYESAVTNHYSPELRARLIAISKQPSLLQSIISTENKILKHCGNLENKATTVPHAGGKILISNFDIPPNSPICELRGKYMLTTQYKTQNASINMNSPPPSNYLQTLKLHKIPGAFIFFYQLPGDGEQNGPEICVDTRTYGNEARFVRRSCRPNAVIQHLFEKGTIHLYVVSLTNIMASTEITIRHEPHDLFALENKKQYNVPIQPTSTVCACGLSKECLFGVLPPMPPATASTKPVRSNSKVVLNGCVDKSATGASKKKAQNINRGRSTSSSGDSNAGLLSPNNNNTSFAPNLYNSTTSIASLMHDSGVYTSSSSPSVSIPSPPTTHISSPPVQPSLQVGHMPHPIQQQMLMSQPPIQHVTHVKLTPPSPQSQSPQQQQQQMIHLPTPPVPLLPHPPIDAGIPAPLIVQTSVIESPPQPVSVNAVSEEEIAAPVPSNTAAALAQMVPQETKLDVPVVVVPQPIAEPVETEVMAVVVQQPSQVPPQPVLVNTEAEQSVIVSQPAEPPTAVCNVQQIPQGTIVQQQLQPQHPHLLTNNIVTTVSSMSPDVTQQIATVVGSPVKSPQKQTCGRKTPAKQPRTSLSEDSSNGTQQQQQQTPTTPTTAPKQEEKRETRKLTREERKMEAILRAFEKMERNQQRKQELKQAKIDVAKRRNSHSPSPKRSNSTDGGSGANSSHPSAKKNSSSVRKKKRKAHKSYNVNSSSQRKRRKSRMNSNDSDGAATSEESTSMLSPPIQGLQNCIPPGGVPNPDIIANCQSQLMSQLMETEGQQSMVVSEQDNAMHGNTGNTTPDANADTAAGLLLAFANPEKDVNNSQDSESMGLDSLKSPERPDISNESQTHSPPPTPTIVSSACLLIEAAVAPLENLPESAGSSGEFKYPAKTKTKKVLMSNWLNQSGDFQPNSENMSTVVEHHTPGSDIQAEIHTAPTLQQHQEPSPSVGLDSLVQAAMCDYGQTPVANPSFMSHGPPTPSGVVKCDEPQNLSIVAKKVEEFIHQSEGSTGANTIESSIAQMSCPRSSLTLPLQVSTCSNNSSVKKRWLRQAISEETDENSTNTPSSASPQLPNGFTTPLKKRRLVISSDDPNAITPGTGDEYTSEDMNRLNSIESGDSLKQYDCEFKEELKNELTDMDDDVDILRSPSPGQKMVAEDNLVKIEPEDVTSGDDVKIDVEREESREGGGEKFEYKEEINEEEQKEEVSSPKVEEKVECKPEQEVKEEEEQNEHVEVVETVKSEDEFIAMADEAADKPTAPFMDLVKEEQKPMVESILEPERPPQPQPLQEIVPTVKSEESKPLHPVKNTKSARKKTKSEEKFSSKQRKSSSSSSTPPTAPKLNNTSTENENIPDELADIQERLHSFHKENIMILQSRNKKTKSPKHSSSTSSSSSKIPSHSSSSDSQKKKTSKKPKKDRKSSPKIEENTSSTSSKSKSAKKSSSSSSSSTSEKEKNRHRTSSSSSSSSKKRQLSFEHIDRSSVGHHKRSNSTSSSKDECSSAKKRRESSRSEDSRKSSSKSSSSHKSTSLALLPFQEAPKVNAASSQPPESSPPQSSALPTMTTAVPLPSVSAPVPPPVLLHAPTKDVDKHLQHAVMTIPFNNFSLPNVANAIPIAGYVVSNSNTTLPPATQGYDMQTLLKVPPAAVVAQQPTTASAGQHLPYYNTIYGKLLDAQSTPTEPATTPAAVTPTTPSTNLMLSDYLDTKAKSYSSLGGYGSHSTLFCGLNSVKSSIPGEVPASVVTTNANTSLPAAESISSRLSTTPIKILTKTASHDPRLNPILTVPEPPPAPKRKLSINEYRKRKQQSTDSNLGSPEGDSTMSTPTTPAIKSGSQPSTGQAANENSFDKAFEECERRNSCNNMTNKIDDTPKVQFSPAPTLLEKQQESISERLKSLKSKQASSGVSSLLVDPASSSSLHGSSTNISLHKRECEFISSTLSRTTNSDLDNCLESISSSSTSLASSRETTPEPRESHGLFNNIATTITGTTAITNKNNSTSVSTTSHTTSIPTPPIVAPEMSLSYSPILDTSADNFDSPIAESIEVKKNAAAVADSDSSSTENHQSKIGITITDTETTSAAATHGKRD